MQPTPESALGRAKAALERWDKLTTDDYATNSERCLATVADLGEALSTLVGAVEGALDVNNALVAMKKLRPVHLIGRYDRLKPAHDQAWGAAVGYVTGCIARNPVPREVRS